MSSISGISYQLGKIHLPNEVLAAMHEDWTPEKILAKTGIANRFIAEPGTCASDLAFAAADRLLTATGAREDVDLLLLCTQSPDQFLPATACLLQSRLGLPQSCAAFDINQGCSGYVYGLGLVHGMLASGQARCALLLTADTYSKYLSPDDLSVRTIFGDGAAATLLRASTSLDRSGLSAFVYGTNGDGACYLKVTNGGARSSFAEPVRLYMDGPQVFSFTLRCVPRLVQSVLKVARLDIGQIDLFVFHQANGYMLDTLRKKLGIPEERFLVHLQDCGNTVSSSIPIALVEAQKSGRLRPGMKTMLVGFGVGYSWGGCIVDWPSDVILV